MHLMLIVSCALIFLYAMTCLGAATVFLFRKSSPGKYQQAFLGFAAGVMIAASIWSLLIPAIAEAETHELARWVPVACGFTLGVFFLLGLDRAIPHMHIQSNLREGPASASKRTSLLIFAVTLHNVPEGMAVGLSFALASHSGSRAALMSAIALAVGIGVQNFPEGAAITLPLRQEGFSVAKAFLLGCLSGAVKPVCAVAALLTSVWIAPVMPWLLCFAAGAMFYVVMEELIPQAHSGEFSHVGTMGIMTGFFLMMLLEVALG